MAKRDPRIDAYITRSAPFARPVMKHFRTLVHKACPGAKETIKWGFPHFVDGEILCSMAAFSAHCAITFWKASLMKDPARVFPIERTSMGHFGRITNVRDLPADRILLAYLREAAALNASRVRRLPQSGDYGPRAVRVPAMLASALRGNTRARQAFRNLSPSHRREYLTWITEAKTAETRRKRVALAVKRIAAGKGNTRMTKGNHRHRVAPRFPK